jgi:hypothetical protein
MKKSIKLVQWILKVQSKHFSLSILVLKNMEKIVQTFLIQMKNLMNILLIMKKLEELHVQVEKVGIIDKQVHKNSNKMKIVQ